MKVAVIDVGFNSLKMVKYKVEPDGSAKSYGQLGVMAKLGEGLERTGYLGNEPISRTIDALRLCRETASLESIDHVLSIGTSPVREAANREEFLKRVQEVTGLKMRVLSGNEEALYGMVGAARSMEASNSLFFDLGGGSLELTYAEKSRIRRILSLPLGALKLTSMYAGKNGTFSRKDRAKMVKHVEQFLPSRRELGLDNDTVLVGTGGTVRAMARYDQDIIEYPFDKVHNYSIGFDSVQQMSREFLKLKARELDKVDAIGEGRSETIAAGALVVRTLMKRLGFKRLTVSTHGLRDGILEEFLEGGVRSRNGDHRSEDVERLLSRPDRPAGLADAAELLECLVRNGLFDERERRIVQTGVWRARAPDCFESDADAVFGILMSEDLPMSHRDQLLMAVSVVRARRPRTANWLMRRYDGVFSLDAKLVKRLGACLKLMEILDRSRAQYRVAYSGGLRISVIASKGPFPFELARMAALAFASAIKKPVTIFVSAKERERHIGLVKVGSEVG
ncbi:MAG: Ppx/GppA family phosphatase [Thaumarchaeota archaeon]|nr:Ppx/GppA family phosphatase [Nitrososphaerota archaeon]